MIPSLRWWTKMTYDINYLTYVAVPKLSLENVDFLNLHLLQNESGLQMLIKTSNVYFRNNYLPLGVLK